MFSFVRSLAAALAYLSLSLTVASSATTYYVRLRPSEASGLYCSLALDLTHAANPDLFNWLVLSNVDMDGRRGTPIVDGGPGFGDLLSAGNPAPSTTFEGQYFYNSFVLPIDSLGTYITAGLSLSERSVPDTLVPDELSMFLLRRPSGLPYPTADGLGTDALFAIDITGDAGGELSVFSPMTFIAPDTLALETGLTAVMREGALQGRLRLTRIVPNPSNGTVRFDYDVPSPGGEILFTLFDVTGRRVATLMRGSRPGGKYSLTWNLMSEAGLRVPPGVYLAHLRIGGQAVVRRLTLLR